MVMINQADWVKITDGDEEILMLIDKMNFDLEIKEEGGPEFDSPQGSIWIVAIDIFGMVTILQAPNIHYGFFDAGNNAEEIGLPRKVEEKQPGVYRWVCSFLESRDWESGIVDGFEFEVDEEELLWSPSKRRASQVDRVIDRELVEGVGK